MAIRPAPQLRPALTVLVLSALGAVGLVTVGVSGPASAAPRTQPSIDSLQKQLGRLALENTQLVEKYDASQVRLVRAEKSATVAAAKAEAAAASYESERSQFVQIVQSQYEGSSLGTAGALLQSQSDADYLERVNSLSMVSNHVAQVVSRVAAVRRNAAAAARSARTLVSTATARRDALVTQRKTVTARIAKYRGMLSTLTSAQRADYLRSQNPSVDVASLILPKAGSKAAQKAVLFAIAQVGKPYVFGAAGPGSFDCSGLTMAAWQAAGVSLPHSAADQYNYGTHVARNDLQPGDLLFFYTPIEHVTIYAGDGLMVSAPTEGENVSVVPVSAFDGDYVGATRLH